MRVFLRLEVALGFIVIACQGRGSANTEDTAQVQQPADSPATAPVGRESRPADTTTALAAGIEPGHLPATPTPSVTSENAIATMRLQLQRLDSASLGDLQGRMTEHTKALEDLLTTMRLEVQAVTSPAKSSWLANADTLEGDLHRLTEAQGEELRTAFRLHRSRVLRLLGEFRVLVPRQT
jgi:hypothetical protein